jgi:hypothetical protein
MRGHRFRPQAVNHIRAKTGPAGFTGYHDRQLTKALLAQHVSGVRMMLDIHHLEGKPAAFHGPLSGMALDAVIFSVNSNAHDSYFHLR